MANSRVTITLGRSGRKVVKVNPSGGRDNGHWPSRGERSTAEYDGGTAEISSGKNRSVMRGEFSSMSYAAGSSISIDAPESRLRPNDLRLKLRRKRISRLAHLDDRLYRRNDRAQSPDFPPDNFSTRRPPSRTSTVPSMADGSMASSYSSRPSNRVARISNHRATTAEERLPPLPSIRPADPSRATRVPASNPFDDPYIPTAIPAPRHPPRELPPPTQGVGVSGFLLSLGLEKYCINFQAEEIDMTTLKQMGDNDLKSIGIPMGPRKKILLTLQAQA